MEPGKIWVYDKPVRIKPEDTIKTTRRLNSFCVCYCLRNYRDWETDRKSVV